MHYTRAGTGTGICASRPCVMHGVSHCVTDCVMHFVTDCWMHLVTHCVMHIVKHCSVHLVKCWDSLSQVLFDALFMYLMVNSVKFCVMHFVTISLMQC